MATTQLMSMLSMVTETIEEFQETDNDAQIMKQIKSISKENKADLLRKMLEPLHDDIELWSQKEDNTKAIKLMLKQKEIAIRNCKLQLIKSIPRHSLNLSLCSDIDNCAALKLIIMLLKKYNDFDDNFGKILMEIESQHKRFVLDLYHHMINHHLHTEFDILYQSTVSSMHSPCNLNICSKFRRHRQREHIAYDEESIDDVHTEYYTDLMDMIHCTFLHSYDTGMRLNNEQKTPEEPQSKTLETVNNKYYTECTTSFDFGHKYYYWNHYKDLDYYDCGANAGSKKGDWYIEQKYDNLQQEIVENEIYSLEKRTFLRATKKAQQYLDCTMSRLLRSDSVELSEYCQIKPGTPITMQHLLVIILYSDYTELCTHFSASFRKYDDETLMEMKDRNSEYWNWSKLLIESVELFGTNICNANIKIFYHGVSYMTFASFLSYFCGPTSCTPQIEVAHNFCGSNGLILELIKENDFSLLKYFNAQWLSAFTNEDERLFIWGNKPLKFNSIRSMPSNEDYHIYIVALTLLDYILSGKRLNEDVNKYNKRHAQIINALMKHHDPTTKYVNKLHKYINDTFVTLIQNRKHISIHLNAVNQDYPFIRQYIPYMFHKKVSNLLLFHQIGKVFKKCETLTLWNDQKEKGGNVLSKTYLDELRNMLSELNYLNNQLSLKTIKLNDVRYNDGNKLKFLDEIKFKKKYSLQFPFCRIKVENKTRFRNKKRSIIRSDLIIDRSMTLLHKAQELSHAVSTIPGINSIHRQWSGNSHSGSRPSSQRPSRVYNPSMTFSKPPIKVAPTTPSISLPPHGLTPILTHHNGYSGIDIAKMNKVNVNTLDSIHETSINAVDPIKTRYSHIIITKKASVTSLWDDAARTIWNSSCLEGDDTVTLQDLYSSLMDHFKAVTKCIHRSPTMNELTPFFMNYNKESLGIHLNFFFKFYLWFNSMCFIIADFKHIYDNENDDHDVLCSLFYSRNDAWNVLEKARYGTFLLRIGDEMNKLYITSKEEKKKKEHHYMFTRVKSETYRIGETNQEKKIFTHIQYSKQWQYLYSPSSLVKKNIYF